MKKIKKRGNCKLTDTYGFFVKSHIIPKSLTKKGENEFFIEERNIYGKVKYHKCFDSWNDNEIVIKQGEKILSELDDFAIKELRRTNLLWSSEKTLITKKGEIELDDTHCYDSKKMRLYFLSLLWRAAVSNLPAFKNINLSEDKIIKLKNLITKKQIDDFSSFPIMLYALSKGEKHNYSAGIDEVNGIKTFKLYHDGLIIRFLDIHNHTLLIDKNGMPSLFVGEEDKITFIKIDYEDSRQKEELEQIKKRYELK